VAKARQHIDEAGLLDVVDLRVGDALESLKNITPDVSIVFLDGLKDPYLPALHLIEPALRPGALVAADDLDLFSEVLKRYLAYVRQPRAEMCPSVFRSVTRWNYRRALGEVEQLRLQRMIAKEVRDPFRGALWIFVAARVDPCHHRSGAGRTIDRASVPAGSSLA
jgi:predicted O-methyltransferase YrrM